MVSTLPVMLRPPSLNRYSTMRATSSTSGSRRSALRLAMRPRPSPPRPWVSSVSMKPGAMTLTMMPTLPTSRAS
jgi:hypothetical protein